MIDTLEARLHATLDDPAMIDAMLRGIDGYHRYRSSLPFVPAGYTRTLIAKHPHFELVAMQWAPSAVSPIHDHGTSRCWVAILEGALDVDNFDRRDAGGDRADIVHSSSLRIGRGELDHRLNWRELHRVRNTGDCSAYSLQLYSPSIREYRVVQEETGICRVVPAIYDSVYDL